MSSLNSVLNMVSSMRSHDHIHLNQMGWLRGKNRTLTNLVNAMLESSDMSYEWWGEVILTANFVLNRVVLKNKDITPYER